MAGRPWLAIHLVVFAQEMVFVYVSLSAWDY